jgi:hypothetical protein
MSNRRRRSVTLTTKLTPEEYAALKTLAGTRPVSEWVRETLFAATTSRPAEGVIVSEVLAFRMLVLNLFVELFGDRISHQTMQRLIAEADAEKDARACDRLRAAAIVRAPSPSRQATP